jgi:hypothetical protein
MGTVVKDPGPGASYDKVVEYELYKMSGCGRPFSFSPPLFIYRVWLMPHRLDLDDEDEEEDAEDDDDEAEADNGGTSFSLLKVLTSSHRLYHGH